MAENLPIKHEPASEAEVYNPYELTIDEAKEYVHEALNITAERYDEIQAFVDQAGRINANDYSITVAMKQISEEYTIMNEVSMAMYILGALATKSIMQRRNPFEIFRIGGGKY